MIKFGFAFNIYTKRNHFDFHRGLDEMSLAGWDGLEFCHKSLEYYLHNISELKNILNLHNLKLSTFYTPLKISEKDCFDTNSDNIKERIQLIKELGSDILLLDCAGGRKPEYTEEDYRIATENIDKVCSLAYSNDIIPTWHQHWGSMFDTKKTFEYLMDSTKDSKLCLCPDTAQLVMSGIDPVGAIEKYKDRISYIHFKDIIENRPVNRYIDKDLEEGGYCIDSKYKITEVCRGIIEFKKVVKILRGIGYSGWVVVDQDYTEYSEIECAKINLKNLKYLFNL